MSVKVRIINGLKPDPVSGDGGALDSYVRGNYGDLIDSAGGIVDLSGGHLLVEEDAPASMDVSVADGIVYIPNTLFDETDIDTIRFWEAVVVSQANLTIGANSSGSTRIDLICAKMDVVTTPDEFASNVASILIVVGTPGAGVPATPSNHYKLAEITVLDSTPDIETGDINDTRAQLLVNADFVPAVGDTITLTAEPGSDLTATGIKIAMTAGENVDFGDICYVKSDGKMWKADASVIATGTGVFMALATIVADASGSFLHIGIARDDSWAWTVGAKLYLSLTAGAITETAPSATDEVIQFLGVATHADRMLFNPQLVQVEHI